jgi:hypothetical protein
MLSPTAITYMLSPTASEQEVASMLVETSCEQHALASWLLALGSCEQHPLTILSAYTYATINKYEDKCRKIRRSTGKEEREEQVRGSKSRCVLGGVGGQGARGRDTAHRVRRAFAPVPVRPATRCLAVRRRFLPVRLGSLCRLARTWQAAVKTHKDMQSRHTSDMRSRHIYTLEDTYIE